MPITFNNDHRFDFGVASGALGFDGNGYWFEQPWRWLGFIKPQEFTIITKTLTYLPRTGNLVWYAPWRAVRLLPYGSVVNAVGLTNPGYEWWLREPLTAIVDNGYKVIISLAPNDNVEAGMMATTLANCAKKLKAIVGIQLNVSCPNTDHRNDVEFIMGLVQATYNSCPYPILVKLSFQQDIVGICRALEGHAAAVELINTVPFKLVFPSLVSPLSKYGYDGGVSGRAIIAEARSALIKVKETGVRVPVISGGGIDCYEEVRVRQALGADAIVFGSVFIRKPWLPNQIVARCRRETGFIGPDININ